LSILQKESDVKCHFILTPDQAIYKWVEPAFMRSDMNPSQGRHSRQSGNLGKDWIPGEVWNGNRDKIHVVMYSKAMPWIFFSLGKDQPGFHFPPWFFLPQESLFTRLRGKLPAQKGEGWFLGRLRRKVRGPHGSKKIFPRHGLEKN
jgi:hypothetical protein